MSSLKVQVFLLATVGTGATCLWSGVSPSWEDGFLRRPARLRDPWQQTGPPSSVIQGTDSRIIDYPSLSTQAEYFSEDWSGKGILGVVAPSSSARAMSWVAGTSGKQCSIHFAIRPNGSKCNAWHWWTDRRDAHAISYWYNEASLICSCELEVKTKHFEKR